MGRVSNLIAYDSKPSGLQERILPSRSGRMFSLFIFIRVHQGKALVAAGFDQLPYFGNRLSINDWWETSMRHNGIDTQRVGSSIRNVLLIRKKSS